MAERVEYHSAIHCFLIEGYHKILLTKGEKIDPEIENHMTEGMRVGAHEVRSPRQAEW